MYRRRYGDPGPSQASANSRSRGSVSRGRASRRRQASAIDALGARAAGEDHRLAGAASVGVERARARRPASGRSAGGGRGGAVDERPRCRAASACSSWSSDSDRSRVTAPARAAPLVGGSESYARGLALGSETCRAQVRERLTGPLAVPTGRAAAAGIDASARASATATHDRGDDAAARRTQPDRDASQAARRGRRRRADGVAQRAAGAALARRSSSRGGLTPAAPRARRSPRSGRRRARSRSGSAS